VIDLRRLDRHVQVVQAAADVDVELEVGHRDIGRRDRDGGSLLSSLRRKYSPTIAFDFTVRDIFSRVVVPNELHPVNVTGPLFPV
jgi:hypothetical protein